PQVNLALHAGRNLLARVAGPYLLPVDLAEAHTRLDQPVTVPFNEAKVRLVSDLTAAAVRGHYPVGVQVTDYLSSVRSSELVGQLFTDGDRARDFPVADLLLSDDALLPLSATTLSAHLGASTVVLTSDHHVLIQRHAA